MTLKGLNRYDVVHFDTNDKTRVTPEGFLIDNPIVTRTGIFIYHNVDGSERKEYRPPEEVFAPESLATYKGKPVILTHDAGYVNTDNVSDEEIGTILSEGYQDGDNVRAEIVIHDTNTMNDSGMRELSLGYNLDLDETPGEYNGEHYDAIQRNIRINHLAVVKAARAGETARLNIDGVDTDTVNAHEQEESSMSKRHDGDLTPEELQKKVDEYQEANTEEVEKKDGDPTEEAPAANEDGEEPTTAEKIQEVRDHRDRRDAEEDPKDPEAAAKIIAEQEKDIKTLLDCIDEMEAEKDMSNTDGDEEEVAAEDGEDEEAKEDCGKNCDEDEEEAMNADSIDRIVSEKLSILRVGDRLNMDGLEKLSMIEMKKAIIKKVNPKMNFDGKSKSYISAAYDYAVDNLINAKMDIAYQKRQMMGMGMNMDAASTGMTNAMKAREAMIAKREGGNE